MTIAASILFGLGVSISSQLLQAKMFSMAGENRKGVVNSTYMLFGDSGDGVGAAVCGAVSEYKGYTITFLLFAFSVVAALIFHILGLAPKAQK